MLLDPAGEAVAYGWRDADAHWLDVPGVASFGFRAHGPEILGFPCAGAREVQVLEAYRNMALPLALHVSGMEVLHASGTVARGGVVGFCGLSGTGKTTTAVAMSRRGHALWADDALVLDPQADHVLVHSLPFRANVRARTREALALDADLAGEGGDTRRLAALVVLERVRESSRSGVRRLPARLALPALLPHCFRFDLRDPDLRRATLRRYLRVAAAVPVLHARFVPSFSALDAFLDELEGAVASV